MAALDELLLGLERKLLAGDPALKAWLNAIDALRLDLAAGETSFGFQILSLVAPDAVPGTLIALTNASAAGHTAAMFTIRSNPEITPTELAQAEAALASDPGASSFVRETVSQLFDFSQEALDVASSLAGSQADDIARSARRISANASSADAAQALRKITEDRASETLAPLFKNATDTRRKIINAIQAAGTGGVRRMAGSVDARVVWVAERDACVRCLKHSGRHISVGTGEAFPPGLTYGPYIYDDAVSGPPLHGHCRCHLEVLNDPAYADALRREADRSILRGYSLPGESMRVRLQAAEKLLREGVNAPKSVKKFAEDALKRGRFLDRRFPGDLPPNTPPPPFTPPAPRAPRTPKPPAPGGAGAADFLALYRQAVDPSVPLSQTMRQRMTIKEASQLFAVRHPGVTMTGWTKRGLDPERSAYSMGLVSDLLEKYPGVKLSAFDVADIPDGGVVAQTATPKLGSFTGGPNPGFVYGTPFIQVNSKYLRDVKTYDLHNELSGATGHFHVPAGEEFNKAHVITHEFGHVIDSNTGFEITQNIMPDVVLPALNLAGIDPNASGPAAAFKMLEWIKSNVSGYSVTKTGGPAVQELIAEAFADVELNGAKALPLSKDIHKYLVKAYNEKLRAK